MINRRLDALAAAHAECGNWAEAIKRQEQAIELAIDEGDKILRQENLLLYHQHKPYRQ